MIESSLAHNSYNTSLQSSGNERGIEYQVFARITRELSTADKDAPGYHQKINEALYKNLRLWAILATDVSSDQNELPKDLRANIFYLSEFTRVHTAKIFAGEADPAILVEINTSIMRGLRGQAAQGEATS